jgi:hypothetical protein
MKQSYLIEALESAAVEYIEAAFGPEYVDKMALHLSTCLYMLIIASGEGGSMSLVCTLRQSDDILDSLRMDGFDQFSLTIFNEEEDLKQMTICFQSGIIRSIVGSTLLGEGKSGEHRKLKS